MFFWSGIPRGQGRPRFNRLGGAYKASEDKAYEQSICKAYWAAYCGAHMLEGPIRVTITAVFQIPGSASKADKRAMILGNVRPTRKPDADNIGKAVLDALNGVAYQDDKAVVDVRVVKIYGERPGIGVEISEEGKK